MKRATRKVGKYEVGRTIGEGTFAKVKFAHNTETGESVAMKVMAKSTILEHRMTDQVLISLDLWTWGYFVDIKRVCMSLKPWIIFWWSIIFSNYFSNFLIVATSSASQVIGLGLDVKITSILASKNTIRVFCNCIQCFLSSCIHQIEINLVNRLCWNLEWKFHFLVLTGVGHLNEVDWAIVSSNAHCNSGNEWLNRESWPD